MKSCTVNNKITTVVSALSKETILWTLCSKERNNFTHAISMTQVVSGRLQDCLKGKREASKLSDELEWTLAGKYLLDRLFRRGI